MWALFAIISSFLETSKDTLGKKVTNDTSSILTAFFLQLAGTIILLPFVLYFGIPELGENFYLTLVLAAILIPVWSIAYMKALETSDISNVIPLLALTPVLTLMLGFFLEEKIPNKFSMFGIIIVSIGIYLARIEKSVLETPLKPFASIINDKGSRYMLIVVSIFSIGPFLAKFNTTASSPLFGSFSNMGLASIILFILVLIRGELKFKVIKKNKVNLSLMGILNGFSEIAFRTALSGTLTPLVVPFKRMNIIWSSLLGWAVYKEKFNKFKIFGILCVFIGLILIYLN